MYVGEDINKVHNIVGGQLSEFRALYGPVLSTMTEYVLLDSITGQGMQDTEALAKHFHLTRLPSGLQVIHLIYFQVKKLRFFPPFPSRI